MNAMVGSCWISSALELSQTSCLGHLVAGRPFRPSSYWMGAWDLQQTHGTKTQSIVAGSPTLSPGWVDRLVRSSILVNPGSPSRRPHPSARRVPPATRPVLPCDPRTVRDPQVLRHQLLVPQTTAPAPKTESKNSTRAGRTLRARPRGARGGSGGARRSIQWGAGGTGPRFGHPPGERDRLVGAWRCHQAQDGITTTVRTTLRGGVGGSSVCQTRAGATGLEPPCCGAASSFVTL